MFGNLHLGEIIIILVLILLLFGAKRLPELARNLGQGMREFRKSMSDTAEPPKSDAEDTKKSGSE